MSDSYFSQIDDKYSVITPIVSGDTFPEVMTGRLSDQSEVIALFAKLVNESSSSADLLAKIRKPRAFNTKMRTSLVKVFRRCVSTVCDTESTKKTSNTLPNETIVENFGHTFKDISILKKQFTNMSKENIAALSALLGDTDKRGSQGYALTALFFEWFKDEFIDQFTIEGPVGSGSDIQLSTVFEDYVGEYPCDFVIRKSVCNTPVAVGFARYDSTRGGSQSDDRTGGNSDKVSKAKNFCIETDKDFKVIFLADGPGLVHGDTWAESCTLDGSWEDNVRVMTYKLLQERLTAEWLNS
ncbi:hypothetical protein AADU81_003844 [Vibrio alginolyticus]